MTEPDPWWPCGPVPEGRRWLTPMECHGNAGFCPRCSPRNSNRATIVVDQPLDEEVRDALDALAESPGSTDHVRCSRCGRRCSNEVPVELVVRAWVECPECVRAQPAPVAPAVTITLPRGGVVTADGFGKVLDPGDTYIVNAPAQLTIQ